MPRPVDHEAIGFLLDDFGSHVFLGTLQAGEKEDAGTKHQKPFMTSIGQNDNTCVHHMHNPAVSSCRSRSKGVWLQFTTEKSS